MTKTSRNTARLLRITGALLGLSAITSLSGQVSAPKDNEVLELDKLRITSDTDLIAAQSSVGTKSSTPLIETPQAISVVTRGELDLRDAKTIAQALRYTAGTTTEFYGEDPRGYNWVKVRGFDTFDSQYLDGLRLFNYELTEAFGLERVEVMKGPSSVLYGQSTPGGLINGVSRHPTSTAIGELTAEVGDGQTIETTLDVGGPVSSSGNLLYRFTGLFHDAEKDSNGYPVNAQRTYLAPALTWRVSPATTLTVLGSYLQGESVQGPGYAVGADGSFTGVYSNDKNWDWENNKIYRLGYELEHRFSSNLVFRQNARASHYDVVDKYLYAYGYEADNVTLDRAASLWASQSRALAFDNQFEWKTSRDHVEQTILAGLDYSASLTDTQYYEDAGPSLDITAPDHNAPVTPPTTMYTDTHQRNAQTGLYLQDQLKFNSRWIATLSGRYDWASAATTDHLAGNSRTSQQDDAFSGRAGVTYLAVSGFAPYASYSTSFYPNSGTDFSGKPFDPTEGRQYEIGFKYAPKAGRASTTLSFYNLTQVNVLTSDPVNIGSYKTAGEWRSRGVEFETKAALSAGFNLLLSASYDDIEITKSNDGYAGHVPYLTPRFNASVWLDHTWRNGALRGLTLGGGARYSGSTFGDDANTVRNDGYGAFDLALSYARGKWRYALNVSNLFDKNQRFSDTFNWYDNPTRTIRVSAAWKF